MVGQNLPVCDGRASQWKKTPTSSAPNELPLFRRMQLLVGENRHTRDT